MVSIILLPIVGALMPPLPPFAPKPTDLLATTAELILRAKLRKAAAVKVDVDGSGPELIGGAVRGVRVRGSDWNTPMSLSCRTLDVSVGRASIDFPALATQQRILLKQPALGSAAIRFSAADWGSFLAHPLMSEALSGFAARAPAPRPSSVRFRRDGATLTPGEAVFFVSWEGEQLAARLTQPRGGPAAVAVEPAADGAAPFLTAFFNGLTIDLDGCELRFRALEVSGVAPSRGGGPLNLLEMGLQLDVCVRRFPSPFVNF